MRTEGGRNEEMEEERYEARGEKRVRTEGVKKEERGRESRRRRKGGTDGEMVERDREEGAKMEDG